MSPGAALLPALPPAAADFALLSGAAAGAPTEGTAFSAQLSTAVGAAAQAVAADDGAAAGPATSVAARLDGDDSAATDPLTAAEGAATDPATMTGDAAAWLAALGWLGPPVTPALVATAPAAGASDPAGATSLTAAGPLAALDGTASAPGTAPGLAALIAASGLPGAYPATAGPAGVTIDAAASAHRAVDGEATDADAPAARLRPARDAALALRPAAGDARTDDASPLQALEPQTPALTEGPVPAPGLAAAPMNDLSSLASTLAPGAQGPSSRAEAPLAEVRLGPRLGTPEFAPALASEVRLLVDSGTQQARVHLNPAELGPITVRIAIEGQSAHVVMLAEQAPTRQALEQAMPALAGALRDAGLTLTGGGVFEQPRDPGQAQGDAANLLRGRGVTPVAGEDPLDAPSASSRPRTPSGLLDVFV